MLAADTGIVLHTSNVHADGSVVSDVDRAGKRLAYRDRESVLARRRSRRRVRKGHPRCLALPDRARVLAGRRDDLRRRLYDGIVTAWRLGEGPSWRLASPLGVSSLSRPTAAFADYVPDGEVLHLFPSPDGHMVGIRRAGEPCADLVLHSTETGRELMRVVAPNKSLNAARAEIRRQGHLVHRLGTAVRRGHDERRRRRHDRCPAAGAERSRAGGEGDAGQVDEAGQAGGAVPSALTPYRPAS